MISFTKGDVKTAFNMVRRNKARSFLTMLGVIIGVTSVVLVVSIGEGVKAQINTETDRLGKGLITIRPGQLLSSDSNSLDSLNQLIGFQTGGTLGAKDVITTLKTPGMASAVPLSIVNGGVVSGESKQHYNALVLGTDENLPKILNQTLDFGAFFDNDMSSADKVVIGSQVAKELYDENVPLGQTLTILNHQFIVVGIFNDFQAAPLSVDADFNNAVFIPYATAEQITNGNSPIYEILARPKKSDETDIVVQRLQSALLAAHGGQHDVTVLKQTQTIAITKRILDLLTLLVGGLAGIALLVGGIGIMNIMLVSVVERMHEIGIRKAIGATMLQILSQFIIEAAVLSISGGLIGVALAFSIDVMTELFTSFNPVMDWRVAALACFVSVGVGVVFGVIPALQAARKDPITALRNE